MAEQAMTLGDVIERLERERDRERVIERGWAHTAYIDAANSQIGFTQGPATVGIMLDTTCDAAHYNGETLRAFVGPAPLTPSRLEAILAPTVKRETLGAEAVTTGANALRKWLVTLAQGGVTTVDVRTVLATLDALEGGGEG